MAAEVFHSLETPRLLLRDLAEDDRDFLFAAFSDDDVTRYLFDAEPMRDPAEADELIAFYRQPAPRAQHRWVLVLRTTGQRIGTCGFHCWDRAHGTTELGYDLLPPYRGQGLMTEALRAALAFARDEMRVLRVDAQIYPDNTRSVAMAARLGFVPSGRTPVLMFRGQAYTHVDYSLFF